MRDIYLSRLRTKGDRGAFFEADDESAYFYLVDMAEVEGEKVRNAIDLNRVPFEQEDKNLRIRVAENQSAIGLFRGNTLLAAFELDTEEAFTPGESEDEILTPPSWVLSLGS